MVQDNIIDHVMTNVFLYIAQCTMFNTRASRNVKVVYGWLPETFHSILVLGLFILLSKSINPLE